MAFTAFLMPAPGETYGRDAAELEVAGLVDYGTHDVREPGIIEGIEFYGIDELSLDELHDELAELFIANAEEAAAHYLGDLS